MAIKASVTCMLCYVVWRYNYMGRLLYARLIASYVCWETLEVCCFRGFFLPRKLKYVHVTIFYLDGHPRKFIHEKLQDDQTSKILYLENFPIYGISAGDFILLLRS